MIFYFFCFNILSYANIISSSSVISLSNKDYKDKQRYQKTNDMHSNNISENKYLNKQIEYSLYGETFKITLIIK